MGNARLSKPSGLSLVFLLAALSLPSRQADATVIPTGGACSLQTYADANAQFQPRTDNDSGGGSPVLCQSSIASSASDQYPNYSSMQAQSAAAVDWVADSLGGVAADGSLNYSLVGWYPPTTGGPSVRGTANGSISIELVFRVDRPTTLDLAAQIGASGSGSLGARIQLIDRFGGPALFDLASGSGSALVQLHPSREYSYRVSMSVNNTLFMPPPVGTGSLSGQIAWSLNAIVVPLPAAVWLLASSMAVLGGARRYFRPRADFRRA